MKVFILEDDYKRVVHFNRVLRGMDVVHRDNVTEAKQYFLNGGTADILLLDHDLGGMQMVDSSEENTGYQFVKWLVENSYKFDQIIIHSYNPIGSLNMAEAAIPIASHVDRIPFSQLLPILEEARNAQS